MLSIRFAVILLLSVVVVHVAGAEELCGGVRVKVTNSEISVLGYDCPVPPNQAKDFILEADKNGDGVIAMWEVEEFQKSFVKKYGSQEVTGFVYIDGKDIPLKVTQVTFQNLYKARVGENRQLGVITTLSGSYALGSGTHTVKVSIKGENTFIDFMIPGVVIKETNGQKGTFNNYPEVKTAQKSGYLMAVFDVPSKDVVKKDEKSIPGFEAVLGLISIVAVVYLQDKLRH